MVSAVVAFLSVRVSKWRRLSLASYVAIAIGCTLVSLTLATWMLFDAEPQRVAWSDYIQINQLLSFFLLGLLICTLSYWTVRTWTDQLPTKHQDIHRAWMAGVQALQHRGTNVADTPIFLLLGCQDPKQQLNFLRKAGFDLAMDPVPADPTAPIRWFISDTCIVMGCTTPGTFSATQARMSLHRVARHEIVYALNHSVAASHALPREQMQFEKSNVLESIPRASHSQENRSSHNIARQGAMDANATAFSDATTATLERSEAHAEALHARTKLGSDDHAALVQLEATESLLADYENVSAPASGRMEPKQESDDLLASKEVVRHQFMLDEICRRLRAMRSPTAAINGTIAWVDAPQLTEGVTQARQLGCALHRDLLQIRNELGLVAPVAIVMDRMDQFPGMVEMIRRSGPNNSATTLLGQTSDVHEIHTAVSIQSLCDQSIDAVRRGVYRCFELPMGANHVGNRKLFRLLIACRGYLKHASQIFLRSAILDPSDQANKQDTPILNGVFFTASGDKPTEQAYGKQILHRMLHQQDLLGWSQQRRRLENRYRLAVWGLQCVCGLLTVFGAIQLIMVLSA